MAFEPSPRAFPFLITALLYLLAGVCIILLSRNRLQRLYGGLALVTASWQMNWVVLLTPWPEPWLSRGLHFFYSAVLFIAPIFAMIISTFKGESLHPRRKLFLWIISISLFAALWTTRGIIDGLLGYTWGWAPKAGWLHAVFPAFLLYNLVRITRQLWSMRQDPSIPEQRRRQSTWVLAATLVYSLGAMDLVSAYGFNLFPYSFVFTGVALLIFGYAMFRHEFLDLKAASETEHERTRRAAASGAMGTLGMQAAFPLMSQGEVLGYLLLGEKKSEEAYSPEDLRLLRIVANQAALAYQRVRYLEIAMHGARTEMLGEIAGGFAHEIKTPLANISLPAEMSFMDLDDLEKGKRTPAEVLPELKSRMKDIMAQVQKASEKIEAIRQFSKPGQVHLEPVLMVEVVDNSLQLLQHMLRKCGISVRHDVPSMPPVRGDAKQLEIVFVNLIKNAAEAMAHNPSKALARELSLKGREHGEWIELRVKDSGPGIRKTDFSHMFQAYFTTKGAQGTGMGLFLCQQVIKAHGGTIEVDSEEGLGTEFVIRLPKYREPMLGVSKAA